MSTPLATTAELGTYLGQTVDDARASLVLQLSHDLCESVVSPVPPLAKSVELSVSARAYTNVTSAHQMSLGSASVSFGSQNSSMGVGGLYLSKSEKATLRRLAGRAGAFGVDLLPTSVPIDSAPVVTGVDPGGMAAGGLVRIEGYGFDLASSVTFGGVDASAVVVTGSVIHAIVPAGAAGEADVVVTNANGASSPFAYLRA